MGIQMGYHYDSKPERRVRDSLDKAGAESLAQKIRDYWADQGFPGVDVKVTEGPFTREARSTRYDVRSNLINGAPRQAIDKLANQRSYAA